MKIDLATNPDRFVLFAEDHEQNEHLRAMPWFRRVDGTWQAPAILPTALAIVADFPERKPTEAARSFAEDLMQRAQLKDTPLYSDIPLNPDLLSFQPEAVAFLIDRRQALLSDDMGLGKTVESLEAVRHLSDGRAGPVLVVAPNTMKFRWAEAAEEWLPGYNPVVLHGPTAQVLRQLEHVRIAAGIPPSANQLVIVNWEKIRQLSGQLSYGQHPKTPDGPLNDIPWDIVIADEAHKSKDPHAQQTRALWRLGRDARFTWAITGSPMVNTPSDLWAMGRFYAPEDYGSSFWKWRQRYVFSVENRFGGGVLDRGLLKRNAEEFRRWFGFRCLRRLKSEVLDLPEITIQKLPLEMPEKQRSAYRRLEAEMIARIKDEILVVSDPLTLLTRLTQMASALPEVEDMEVVSLGNPSNKIAALKEIISDTDSQVVVFAMSRKLIELAAQELKGLPFMEITGTVSAEQRAANVSAFQRGERTIALCTYQAGGEGIDLYAADLIVCLQQPWSPALRDQAIARCHRHGQRNPVTVLELVSRETVDEDIAAALSAKAAMSEEVLRDSLRKRYGL